MELFHLFDYSIDFFLTFILVVFIFVLYITGWCREKSGAEKVVYFPCPPKSQFKFPWKIAEFVSQGKRQGKIDELSDYEYELICDMWNQHPKERIGIDEVVDRLEKYYYNK